MKEESQAVTPGTAPEQFPRSTEIRTIGILTSGGDAPGMNPAIRSVTRTAIAKGLKVKGIYRGYKGLIEGSIREFHTEDVSNIIQRGGTILKTARSMEFMTKEGRSKAWANIVREEIDALVVIGGDGSLSGAQMFAKEYDFPIVGIPGTIDNDLAGTDRTLGADTALNTIMDAVDKLRDTASSHDRLFVVEVMGRDSGFLALNGALASGAEVAVIPEYHSSEEQMNNMISSGFRKSKNSAIIIVAESPKTGGANGVVERIKAAHPEYEARVVILGYIQRGGSPCAQDRILASRMGVAAVEALLDGQRNVMIGIQNDSMVNVSFSKAIKKESVIREEDYRVLGLLAF